MSGHIKKGAAREPVLNIPSSRGYQRVINVCFYGSAVRTLRSSLSFTPAFAADFGAFGSSGLTVACATTGSLTTQLAARLPARFSAPPVLESPHNGFKIHTPIGVGSATPCELLLIPFQRPSSLSLRTGIHFLYFIIPHFRFRQDGYLREICLDRGVNCL